MVCSLRNPARYSPPIPQVRFPAASDAKARVDVVEVVQALPCGGDALLLTRRFQARLLCDPNAHPRYRHGPAIFALRANASDMLPRPTP